MAGFSRGGSASSDQDASRAAPLPSGQSHRGGPGTLWRDCMSWVWRRLGPPPQPGISSKKLLVRRRPGTPCLRLLPLRLILGWVEENGWVNHSAASSNGLSITGLSLHSLSCVILVVTSERLMKNSKQKVELRTETCFDSLEWCLYKRTNTKQQVKKTNKPHVLFKMYSMYFVAVKGLFILVMLLILE